ncbi:VOC family protein [Nonomuraea dietziae]|uniref:VOC family protein n=1 Tax=Nonomuraea dietziae TaxID=65515 RepID=UPI0033FD4F72
MSGIARMRSTVLDCADPQRLGRFYAELVGWEITGDEDDWVVVSDGGRFPRLAFQKVDDYRPPAWPGAEMPQQFHLDVTVDDLEKAEAQVLAIGATKHEFQPSEEGDFRVFLDPEGHPFCLCLAEDG